jgi:hypothetical protein
MLDGEREGRIFLVAWFYSGALGGLARADVENIQPVCCLIARYAGLWN